MIDQTLCLQNSMQATQEKVDFQVRVSHEINDSSWNTFLEKTPGGHHVQTSLWAQVKALSGWRSTRIIAMQGRQIVGGAQMLIRTLPFAGSIGYVPKGPVLASDDEKLGHMIIDELHKVAKINSINYLLIQPPHTPKSFVRQLPEWGFQASTIRVAQPTATVQIDLAQDLDSIMSRMNSKTRYNIRLGLRKGITVREGTHRDLPTFYQLLSATAKRQNFSPEPEEFYDVNFRYFDPSGNIKLFFAEYEGEAVSGLLAVPFGDTVIYKRGGWSGHHGKLRPNEVLHWGAIQWSKANNYRYYDFEGILPEAAKIILKGNPLPPSMRETTTRFKLQFGGQVCLLPRGYDYVYNPIIRWFHTNLSSKILNWSLVERVLNRFRTN